MEEPLFIGEGICLAALDAGRDARVMARWTEDPDYQHLVEVEPPRPLSAGAITKAIRARQAKEDNQRFEFGIRTLDGDRLVGIARLERVDWMHGDTRLSLAIPDPADRGRGYGSQALALLLRFAFDELNLHRVTCPVFEYNLTALAFLEKAGFAIEVRRRGALYRAGRRWDALILGLLREEWTPRAAPGEAQP